MKVIHACESSVLVEVASKFNLLFGSYSFNQSHIRFLFDFSDIRNTNKLSTAVYAVTPLCAFADSSAITSVSFHEPVAPLPGGWVAEAIPSGGVFSCHWRLRRGDEEITIVKQNRAHPFALEATPVSRGVFMAQPRREISDPSQILRESLKMLFGDKVLPVFEISDLDVDTFLHLLARLLQGCSTLKSSPAVLVHSASLAHIFAKIPTCYEWLSRLGKLSIHEGLKVAPNTSPGLFARERAEGRLAVCADPSADVPICAFALVTTTEEKGEVLKALGNSRKYAVKKVSFDFPSEAELQGNGVQAKALPFDYVSKVQTKQAWIRRCDLANAADSTLKVTTDCGGRIVLVKNSIQGE